MQRLYAAPDGNLSMQVIRLKVHRCKVMHLNLADLCKVPNSNPFLMLNIELPIGDKMRVNLLTILYRRKLTAFVRVISDLS